MPGEPPPENLAPPIPGTYLAVPVDWMRPSGTTVVVEASQLHQ
jgi:hypothetical protein